MKEDAMGNVGFARLVIFRPGERDPQPAYSYVFP